MTLISEIDISSLHRREPSLNFGIHEISMEFNYVSHWSSYHIYTKHTKYRKFNFMNRFDNCRTAVFQMANIL